MRSAAQNMMRVSRTVRPLTPTSAMCARGSARSITRTVASRVIRARSIVRESVSAASEASAKPDVQTESRGGQGGRELDGLRPTPSAEAFAADGTAHQQCGADDERGHAEADAGLRGGDPFGARVDLQPEWVGLAQPDRAAEHGSEHSGDHQCGPAADQAEPATRNRVGLLRFPLAILAK